MTPPAKTEISKTLVVITSITFLIMILLSVWLLLQQTVDQTIVVECNSIYKSKIMLFIFQNISRYGMSFICLLYAFLLLHILKKKETPLYGNLFLIVLFSFAIGGIAGELLKPVFDRARPIIELGNKLTVTDISDTASFPSGHASKSMALALPFVFLMKKKNIPFLLVKTLVLLVGLLVCLSRVALQKHYPSDVLAGVAIAFICILPALWLANKLVEKNNIDSIKLINMNKRFILVFILLAVVISMI